MPYIAKGGKTVMKGETTAKVCYKCDGEGVVGWLNSTCQRCGGEGYIYERKRVKDFPTYRN
jgi:DnaJ-class molecular chaperone